MIYESFTASSRVTVNVEFQSVCIFKELILSRSYEDIGGIGMDIETSTNLPLVISYLPFETSGADVAQ